MHFVFFTFVTCKIKGVFHLFNSTSGYPMGLAQNPFMNAKTPDALVDVTESGTPRDKFLRSFCRYCHSQPFFCGELLELCYARFRL